MITLSAARAAWAKWSASASDADRVRQQEDQILLTLIISVVVRLVVVAFILVTENLGARMYAAAFEIRVT